MKSLQRWMPVVAAAGVLVGASIAGAWRPAPSAPLAAPTSIGLVRLGTLMDGLREVADKTRVLEARLAQMRADLQLLKQEIQTLQDQVQAGTFSGARRLEALQEIGEKQVLHEARERGYEARLDIARGDMMREVYDKIVLAAEQFARQSGYDMIVVDDRTFPLATPGRSTTQQHLESIQRRRVLHASGGMDVTEALMTQMNNAYQAGAPAGSGARP